MGAGRADAGQRIDMTSIANPTADAMALKLATPLMDTDIQWDLEQSSPWPTTDVLVSASLRALPSIEDELGARLILELLHAITTLQTQVSAQRAVISEEGRGTTWYYRVAPLIDPTAIHVPVRVKA